MKTWHVDEFILGIRSTYGVTCSDGEVYAHCRTQHQADKVCSALNFQESQVNRGAYPSEPITSSTEAGKEGAVPDSTGNSDACWSGTYIECSCEFCRGLR